MSNKPTHSSETHRIEFKRELNAELDLEKEVIAFPNSPEGGFIYLQPALAAELIEPTIPDKPNSRLQQYRLTAQAKALLK